MASKAVADDGNLLLRDGENYLWAYPAGPGRHGNVQDLDRIYHSVIILGYS